MAPLLPKLRGHFAEFLNKSYLARLRILSLPTCVGLRYGHLNPSLETFLGSVGSVTSVLNFPRHHTSGLTCGGFAYHIPYVLKPAFPAAGLTYPTASSHHSNGFKVVSDYQPIFHRLRFTPRLRSRLTLGGRAFPRKP